MRNKIILGLALVASLAWVVDDADARPRRAMRLGGYGAPVYSSYTYSYPSYSYSYPAYSSYGYSNPYAWSNRGIDSTGYYSSYSNPGYYGTTSSYYNPGTYSSSYYGGYPSSGYYGGGWNTPGYYGSNFSINQYGVGIGGAYIPFR